MDDTDDDSGGVATGVDQGKGTSALYSQYQSMMDPAGAINQERMQGLGNLQKAEQLKKQRIQDAIGILQQTRQAQSTNLPLLMAGAGMMAPSKTGTFSEGLSNAASAAAPYIDKQRNQDLGLAKTTGGLGIEDADTDYQYYKDSMKEAANYYGAADKTLQPVVTAETWGTRGNQVADRQVKLEQMREAARAALAGETNELKRQDIIRKYQTAANSLGVKMDLGTARIALEAQRVQQGNTRLNDAETQFAESEARRRAALRIATPTAADKGKSLNDLLSEERGKLGLQAPKTPQSSGVLAPFSGPPPTTNTPKKTGPLGLDEIYGPS